MPSVMRPPQFWSGVHMVTHTWCVGLRLAQQVVEETHRRVPMHTLCVFDVWF
jgi:hypothetical protein